MVCDSLCLLVTLKSHPYGKGIHNHVLCESAVKFSVSYMSLYNQSHS